MSWVIRLFFLFGSISLGAQGYETSTQKLLMTFDGHRMKIPVFSNYPINEVNSDIEHAVIVIHGTNRDSDKYYADMVTAASLRPEESASTLIIAPQFLTEEDVISRKLDEEHLYWTSAGWKSGLESRTTERNPRPELISSYAVMDSLLIRLAQNFPQLESVIFTGHSAGGQLVNRFSASSPIPDVLCSQYGVNMKFIVANPSSYVYLDGRRRVKESTNVFAVPDFEGCLEYNEWKYGLEKLYDYQARSGPDSIRAMLKRREVVYLLGGNDKNPNASGLDNDCPAILQGLHRLERGSVYFNYLISYYGEEIRERHSIDTVPRIPHSAYDMYVSKQGLYHLFESFPKRCFNQVTPTTEVYESLVLEVFPNPTTGLINLSADFEHSSVVIYDLLGRVVKRKDQLFGSSAEIDLSDMAEGVYLLELRTGANRTSQLIIKREE